MNGFRDQVLLFCRRVTIDAAEAEDLAQDVFIRVWRGLERFRQDSSLTTWIYRIAWNVCASHLKKKGRTPTKVSLVEDQADEDKPSHPQLSSRDSEFVNLENRQFLEMLFQQLQPMHRMVLTLYYMKELSYKEISEITDMPMGSVKVTLHRAKEKLRFAAAVELKAKVS